MRFAVRPMAEHEYVLLEDFLYEAVFVPEGAPAPPRSIVRLPELRVYIEDFGKRRDDAALAAEADGRVIGAIWARVMDDYGHVDGETPSLAIAVLKEYRGRGAGTAMLGEMLRLLKQRNYKRVSLSVQRANYAVKMYLRAGFEVVRGEGEEYVMLRRLWPQSVRATTSPSTPCRP
ncbi:N-acetyltransferase [Cloacibacillus sp. An23]|uniref:GNAT family N-acetyltransferase n=1 Tax=Cloacibacillus sp. An23 TaxID=1965591 RepID=UPI000B3ACF50|nr:GNAT family N-acetyltransferase [Cloacibacillus sp. An23]